MTVSVGSSGSFFFFVDDEGRLLSSSDSPSFNGGADLRSVNGVSLHNQMKVVPWDGPRITAIVCSSREVVILDEERQVWKQIAPRQLGMEYTLEARKDLPRIVQISAGSHCLALDEEGFVWGWTSESNDFHQIGKRDRCQTPQKLSGLSNIKQVSCGYQFSLAEADDGTIWGWGCNSSGQLGLSLVKSCSLEEPRMLELPEELILPLRGMYAGGQHSVLIDRNGVCWTAGWNQYGQLGEERENCDRFYSVRTLPPLLRASVNYSSVLAEDESGTLWIWGREVSVSSFNRAPTTVPQLGGASLRGSSEDYFLLSTENHRLLILGRNTFDDSFQIDQSPLGVSPSVLRAKSARSTV
jgi:hypothetical protein